MSDSGIRREIRELDEVTAKLRSARKAVEAWDTVSLPKKTNKDWARTGESHGR